jgi:G:T-mismatch repair DNA endonuclease (very short patch repair protein)
MAKKSSYSSLLKKAVSKAKFVASPPAAKAKKKKRLEKSAKKMSNKMTEPERIFAEMMNELDILFESQKIVENKIFDFYIPSKNMIVEVHGDYWHSNPLIYEGKELNKIQIKNQRNDIFKDILAKGRGFEVEVVWEYDLKNNYKEQKDRFKKLLKNE